mmetsp:Transcript_20468/g.42897  ORF Transcript_20468/g.42897 Transcript_20468/m.42897 type:complete len:141 (+) Transcript_20468:824-1246(+)
MKKLHKKTISNTSMTGKMEVGSGGHDNVMVEESAKRNTEAGRITVDFGFAPPRSLSDTKARVHVNVLSKLPGLPSIIVRAPMGEDEKMIESPCIAIWIIIMIWRSGVIELEWNRGRKWIVTVPFLSRVVVVDGSIPELEL